MKFSIITPTHKRKDSLKRAVDSVLAQRYSNWEMIIINDSPEDLSYLEFSSKINDRRICYYINEKNSGVNFSRNRGLDVLSSDSNWIIFLDDDDYLAPDALMTFKDLINAHRDTKWFITNRAYKNGESLTQFPKPDKYYSYAWDYLILKNCIGDATHCIKTEELHHIRFSRNIKQGEEWFFFYQVGIKNEMYYYDHNSTITGGYNVESGLNFRKRSKKEKIKETSKLFTEAVRSGFGHKITLLIYIMARYIKIVAKK